MVASGWNSNIIVSNNASRTLGASLQSNYSEPFELTFLSWFGPWTINIFIGKLNYERVIDNAKLISVTVGFRPAPKPRDKPSPHCAVVTELADNCGIPSCKAEEPGNQLNGINARCNLPYCNSALHWQTVGEDEAARLPSKRAS